MKERAWHWHVAWITAAIALVASIILIIGITAHQRAESIDGAVSTATVAAAQAAGASAHPSGRDPDPHARLQ